MTKMKIPRNRLSVFGRWSRCGGDLSDTDAKKCNKNQWLNLPEGDEINSAVIKILDAEQHLPDDVKAILMKWPPSDLRAIRRAVLSLYSEDDEDLDAVTVSVKRKRGKPQQAQLFIEDRTTR